MKALIEFYSIMSGVLTPTINFWVWVGVLFAIMVM